MTKERRRPIKRNNTEQRRGIKMTLQRRHYVIIADILAQVKNEFEFDTYDGVKFNKMLEFICSKLADNNSKFNDERFTQAVNQIRGLY